MSITAGTTTEKDLHPNTGKDQPAKPFDFAKTIQYSQPKRSSMQSEHTILFNKGRYFETSIYSPQILTELCELTGFKHQDSNMIVQPWTDLEDFVIAMNILGIYVDITVDWI
jgi:hypothetical protein